MENGIRNDQAIKPVVPEQILEMLGNPDIPIIGFGAFGTVFECDGLAIKVGHIVDSEPMAQQWVHENLGHAFPVLGYFPDSPVPENISKIACPVHGLLGYDEIEGFTCHCGENMDILVSPAAEEHEVAGKVWGEEEWPEVKAMIETVTEALIRELNHFWDDRPQNVVRHRGKFLMIDFGEELEDDW